MNIREKRKKIEKEEKRGVKLMLIRVWDSVLNSRENRKWCWGERRSVNHASILHTLSISVPL
jgi:hypothetical protein